MKNKIKYIISILILCAVVYKGYTHVIAAEYINKNETVENQDSLWQEIIAGSINSKTIQLRIDGVNIVLKKGKIYMDKTMNMMVPLSVVTEAIDCAVDVYSDNSIIIERGNNRIDMTLDSNIISINQIVEEITTPPVKRGSVIYIPLNYILKAFGYSYSFDISENIATVINETPQERSLPYAYCYTDYGKVGEIKNQGYFGTCWATSALSALESSLLPLEKYSFAVDHMSINNSFKLSQYDGGDYLMAIAYLAAWQGPVLENDDPYGDGVSDNSLKAVKHVQEAQILPPKDFETIKKMVYKYGGVSTSIYTSLNDSYGRSKYYNKETASYCYIGEEKSNHEVVIVGWDDNYPKENFNAELEGNGAFICQNSWGKEFGMDGLFYVSYYDANIGIHNVVYTGTEPTDNYDNIYQSDLCGWRGNLGYDKESAYFANVYKAVDDEKLSAVSFYATDVDTYYEIAVCSDYKDSGSLDKERQVLASGTLKYSGYYTIDLDREVKLKKGNKFAIVMYISTPNATRPIAVELATDAKSAAVDLSDGEGYISYTGAYWDRVEEKYQCNLCLKGFTKIK